MAPKAKKQKTDNLSRSTSSTSEGDVDPIFKILKGCDPEALEAYLGETDGRSINDKNKKAQTPLHVCCENRDVMCTEVLLKHRAKVDIPDREGKTALHCAIMHGGDDIVPLLIQRGARVDAQDRDGLTPVHWAARMGDNQITKLLLGDIEVDEKDDSDEDSAPTKPQPKRKPVNKAALLRSYDHAGNLPIHYAITDQNQDVTKYLLQVMKQEVKDYATVLNAPNKQGLTPVHLSCRSGESGTLRELLGLGCDYTSNSGEGTALHEAVRGGDRSCVELILKRAQTELEGEERKKFINAATLEEGQTALHLASYHGNSAAVDLLLGAPDIDLEVKATDGSTALVAAWRRKHTDIFKVLEKRADGSALEAFKQHQAEEAAKEAKRGDYSGAGRDAGVVPAGRPSRPVGKKRQEKDGMSPLVMAIVALVVLSSIIPIFNLLFGSK